MAPALAHTVAATRLAVDHWAQFDITVLASPTILALQLPFHTHGVGRYRSAGLRGTIFAFPACITLASLAVDALAIARTVSGVCTTWAYPCIACLTTIARQAFANAFLTIAVAKAVQGANLLLATLTIKAEIAVASGICTHAISRAVAVFTRAALLAAINTTPPLRTRACERIHRAVTMATAGLADSITLVAWAGRALAVEATKTRIA